MKLLRSFHALSFALVFISIVALCLAQQSISLLLVAGALAAISWTITEGPRGRRLPRWAANILVLGVTLHSFVDYLQGSREVLFIIGQFALWLTLIKLYERRTPRDHAQLLFFSLLLMLIGCLHTTDLMFAILLLLYAGLGVYVVLLYQLHAAHDRERLHRARLIPAGYRLAPVLKPVTGRRVDGQFKLLVSGVGTAGLAISVLAFLLFPRGVGEAQVGQLSSPSGTTRPSFSSQVDLLHGGRITDSRRVVMQMRLLDQSGRPVHDRAPIRLRGAVLDEYKGEGRWGRSDRAGFPIQVRPNQPALVFRTEPVGGTVVQDIQTITESDVLFSMYAPLAVAADEQFTINVDPGHMTLRSDRDSSMPNRYRVTAHPAPSEEMLQRLIHFPQRTRGSYDRLTNPEIEQLTRDVLAESNISSDPPEGEDETAHIHWNREVAHGLLRYFHSPRFHYTIDLSDVRLPTDPETGRLVDPVQFFLLELKRGHCEYFAAAFVAMCRNIGVEARLVTGYLATTYNERAQHYVVMERNAHAWAEVRTGQHQWTTFDPTPPSTLEEFHRSETGWADQVRWMYDRFDGFWSESIVSYDSQTQSQLAAWWEEEQIADQIGIWIVRARAWLDRVNQAFYLGPAGYIYVGFLSALLIFFIVVLIGLLRRLLTIQRVLHLEHLRGKAYRRMLNQLGFYLDMQRILRRAGLAKPDWRPPRDHAELVSAKHPEAAESVQEVTRLFYEARYGGRQLKSEERHKVDQCLTDLAAVLGVRRGGWFA